MYCKHCGKEIDAAASFCSHCGEKVTLENQSNSGMRCPNCGSHDIDIQVHQENIGGATVTKTKSKYREKGHGCLWWLVIGWWWWAVDLCLWVFAFPFRLIAQLFKKKKYVGNATSVSSTKNEVQYRTVHLCKSCGHHWE